MSSFYSLPQTVCRVALKLPMTIFANKVPLKFVIRHAEIQLTVTIATVMFEILSRESCELPMIFGFSSILSHLLTGCTDFSPFPFPI